MKKLDFFARWPHYLDHLAPIYKEMDPDYIGDFYVSDSIQKFAENLGIKKTIPLKPRMLDNDLDVAPPGNNPMLLASVGDLQMAYSKNQRPFILMEHGVGITFPGNPSYAGNFGHRRIPALTLAPNSIIFDKTAKALPEMRQEIIGTPMLDRWEKEFWRPKPLPEVPTIAIAFHWDGSRVAPEAGNAFRHYQEVIPRLAASKRFKLIAHGHPRNLAGFRGYYESLGIEVVEDFVEVMMRANLLINDCSSIAYMFLVTGCPVILLNAPWFRKSQNFGIRFWDYTDIGEQVENPGDLLSTIEYCLSNINGRRLARANAVIDLFPFLGKSAPLTALILKNFLQKDQI